MPHPAAHRWIGPLIGAGLVISVCFAAVPNPSGWLRGEAAGPASDVRSEAAALNAIRLGFLRARLAERDLPSAVSMSAEEAAVLEIRKNIATVPYQSATDAGRFGAIRAAIDTYAATTGSLAALKRRPDAASTDTIDAVLGQLETRDEAVLREPLLGMQLSEAAFLSGADRSSMERVSRASDRFSERLAGLAIPEGTRARLTAKLVAYERDVSGTNDTVLAAQNAEGALRNAALAVEGALRDADRAVSMEQARLTASSDAARQRGWWLLGAGLVVSVLCVASLGFVLGRSAVVNRGMSRLGAAL